MPILMYMYIYIKNILYGYTFVYQFKWWPSWSWSYGWLIYNYLCNQCLSPLTLWVRSRPFMARCMYLIQHYVIKFVSYLRQIGTFLSVYSGFLHQWNWPPQYSWNIVESGFEHHSPNPCISHIPNWVYNEGWTYYLLEKYLTIIVLFWNMKENIFILTWNNLISKYLKQFFFISWKIPRCKGVQKGPIICQFKTKMRYWGIQALVGLWIFFKFRPVLFKHILPKDGSLLENNH